MIRHVTAFSSPTGTQASQGTPVWQSPQPVSMTPYSSPARLLNSP